ncbi:AMP-binding protein [Streptomyces massasporeus]|uniref:AMP-binding protein n=1 Tax=Streptomyces massasporeus TaxID=67324 RepID=A0ABW6LF95_9ACTN
MTSVFDPVRRHAAATPDNIALRGGTDEWTYRQLHDASVGYAGALTAAGLSPGDRVLLAAPSVPQFVVAYLGIQAAGCVVVPVNTMSTRAEINVYPGEVEEVLYEHPDIVEAAVIGVPHDHYGEEVAVLIAARSGSELGAAEVSGWVRERLSAYKVPCIVRFVDALPKGPTGKILKRSIDRSALTRDAASGDVAAGHR